MPPFLHTALVDIFHEHLPWTQTFLHTQVKIPIPSHTTTIEAISKEVSQLAPAERRADLVLQYKDPRTGKPVIGVIFKIQLHRDEEKRFSWPCYLYNLCDRLQCPVYLIVLAPKGMVAQWCGQPILAAQPNTCFSPLVIDLSKIAGIENLEEALQDPKMVVLSAVGHPNNVEVICMAFTAITQVLEMEEEKRKSYKIFFDLLLYISEQDYHVKMAMEEEMKSQDFVPQSAILKDYFAQAEAKGFQKGKEERNREIAQRMLAQGFNTETITSLTGLDQETIQLLQPS